MHWSPGVVMQTEVGAEGNTVNSFQMETNISLSRGFKDSKRTELSVN